MKTLENLGLVVAVLLFAILGVLAVVEVGYRIHRPDAVEISERIQMASSQLDTLIAAMDPQHQPERPFQCGDRPAKTKAELEDQLNWLRWQINVALRLERSRPKPGGRGNTLPIGNVGAVGLIGSSAGPEK